MKLPVRARGAPATAKPRADKRHRQDRPLTASQKLFIGRYVAHRNATRAYLEAFPEASAATADTEGPKLTKHPRISSEISHRIAAIVASSMRTAEDTLDEIAKVAFANLTDYFDGHGRLIPPHELPREIGAAIKRIERVELKGVDAGGNSIVIGHTVRVGLLDKLTALRMLGQYFQLFAEKVVHATDDAALKAMAEGRKRALAR